VPSSVVSAFAGAAFSWAVGSAVIWVGMVLGCVVAYALGASAGRVLALPVVGEGELARAQRLFSDIGPAALILTRGVPVLAEAGAMAAGAARMPFWTFMAATSLANAGIAAAYAATGALAASAHSFMLVFIGLIAVPAVGWGAWRLWTARRARTSNQKSS
jgi:membrane protein DedA with SNARE-associated domain